jgi:transposase
MLARMAHSRTAATRDVERARIIWLASQSQRIPTIAVALHLSANTTRRWLKCFNADGLAGLTDACRSGRPATYTPGQVAEVIATPLTDPQPLHLPFGSWTLDRLKGYIFGAFARPQGMSAPSRTSVVRQPVGRTSSRTSRPECPRATDVWRFSLMHPRWEFVFQAKYAAYLNLIEPW